MAKHILTAAVLAATWAGAAAALEPVELNITYPTNEQLFKFPDSWFFTQDNKGTFEVVKGPFENGPARCIGSGFGDLMGQRRISGICIFGEGADTFTIIWKTGDGDAANTWGVAAGTGRYEGMTGEGTATTGTIDGYQNLPIRRTHVSGYVTFPDN